MLRKMKTLLTAAVALSSATAFAQGYYADGYNSYDGRGDCCSSWWDNLSVRGEVLVWKTDLQGSHWGARETNVVTGSGSTETIDTSYRRRDFNFDFDVGFRVGIGYNNPCSDWNVDLSWTYFHPSESASGHTDDVTNGSTAVSGSFDLFVPTADPVGFAADRGFNAAKAKLKLDFDDVWLTTSRRFVCNCFEWEAFAGLDYLRIENKRHFNAEFVNSAPAVTAAFSSHQKNTFQGGGVIVGIKNKWDWGCGLSLLSRLSGGAAYGSLHSKSHAEFFPNALPNAVVTNLGTQHGKYHRDIIVPQLNFDIGLGWSSCLCGFDYDLYAKWEFNRYFGANFVNQGRVANQGDLSFQGLTAGLNVKF